MLSNIKLITELSTEEEIWWSDKIKSIRKEMIKEPKSYTKEILSEKGITKIALTKNIDKLIFETRDAVWKRYLEDETMFHSKVIEELIKERDLPKDILSKIVTSRLFNQDLSSLSKEEILKKVASVIGDFTGRIMPYIYALSLSTTQSRRSRSGKTFEQIIEIFMKIFDYPFSNQSGIGKSNFEEKLGKKVDMIIPGAEEYTKNRSKCAILTLKTSLRERWQEVAEELTRTNVPHIYLLTTDTSVTRNAVNIMKQYNITLVVYEAEKKEKFSNLENVKSFEDFFIEEIPHLLGYWK